MQAKRIFLVTLTASIAWPALSPAQREDRRDEDRRGPARTDERREPQREGMRHEPPHFAQFRRGDHLAPQYRHPYYVVEDWRVHHLHAPPRGYHWVSIGPDLLLVAIATGVIAEVLANGQAQASGVPPTAPPPPGPVAGPSAPPAANVWYFCQSANAYYPYVTQCPEGWRVVPAAPAQ